MPFTNPGPGFSKSFPGPVLFTNFGVPFLPPAANLDIPLTQAPTNVTITAGAQNIGPQLQISQFQSFKMNLTSSSNGTTPVIGLTMEWSVNTAPGVFSLIDEDYFTFSANGTLNLGCGVVRGTHLRVRLTNYDSVSTNTICRIFGSERAEPRPQFRSGTTRQGATENPGWGTDNILTTFVTGLITASGGTFTLVPNLNFYSGPVQIKLHAFSGTVSAAKTVKAAFSPLPKGVLNDSDALTYYFPASADLTSPLVTQATFARRVMGLVITNNSTGTVNVSGTVMAQEL